MSDLILKLALQAMTDTSVSYDETAPASFVVFLDALEEFGWYPIDRTPEKVLELLGEKPRWESARLAFARAVAAVLLFEGWPQHWELATQCSSVDHIAFVGFFSQGVATAVTRAAMREYFRARFGV